MLAKISIVLTSVLSLVVPAGLEPVSISQNQNLTTTLNSSAASNPAPIIPIDPVIPQVNSGVGLVSLNFDDGYESQYRFSEFLDEKEFKATFYVITQYDFPGYMTKGQIAELSARGHEIGSHTRTHAHLAQLQNEQVSDEIYGSKNDLLNFGITADTFAYPYGELNDSIRSQVLPAYSGARGVGEGFNDKNSDRYNLKTFGLDVNSDLKKIKKAIDEVEQNKKWLIIDVHRIGEDSQTFNVSRRTLRELLGYIGKRNVEVVTNRQALSRLGQIE